MRQTLLWSKTFLLGNSFSPYKGDDLAFALLNFDMNLLFESYVGAYLKKQGLNISLQDKQHHLVVIHLKKFALRPDIVIETENEIIIADTKWKCITEEKDISQTRYVPTFCVWEKIPKSKTLFDLSKRWRKTTSNLVYQYEIEKSLELKVFYFDVTQKISRATNLRYNSALIFNTKNSHERIYFRF